MKGRGKGVGREDSNEMERTSRGRTTRAQLCPDGKPKRGGQEEDLKKMKTDSGFRELLHAQSKKAGWSKRSNSNQCGQKGSVPDEISGGIILL